MVHRLMENHIVRGSVAHSDLQLKASFASSPLHRSPSQYYTLPHTATHCNTLPHTATHCHILQHTATHCNTLPTLQHTTTHCNTLQHTATHCNTLQHTATHCNTLQHTATRRPYAFRNRSTKGRRRPIECLKLQLFFTREPLILVLICRK